jgi:hypothetical protein
MIMALRITAILIAFGSICSIAGCVASLLGATSIDGTIFVGETRSTSSDPSQLPLVLCISALLLVLSFGCLYLDHRHRQQVQLRARRG